MMMKNIFYSILFIMLTANCAFGQAHKNDKNQPYASMTKEQKNLYKIKAILKGTIQTNPVKKTRGASRLIAEAGHFFTAPPASYDPLDSTHYYFKSNYGYDVTAGLFELTYSTNSLYDKMQNRYDSSYYWSYDIGSSAYIPDDSSTCSFVSNHKLESERTTYFQIPFYSNISYTYDANERIISELDTSISAGTTYIEKYNYTYNANNKVIYMNYLLWDAGLLAWVPNMSDSVFYDANNNISKFKTFQYNTTSSAWEKLDLYTFTYNASNNLLLVVQQVWDGTSAWENDYKTAYLYNGSNQLVSTTNSTWDLSIPAWVPLDKDSLQYGAGLYPSVRIIQNWDGSSGWFNVDFHQYQYNSFQQILQDAYDTWDSGSSTWVHYMKTNYYYENYTPEGVRDTKTIAGEMNIYPVPASDEITIYVRWNEVQASTLSLSDMMGNTVKTMALHEANEVKQTLDISMLPKGVYVLTMKGEKGIITSKIVKE